MKLFKLLIGLSVLTLLPALGWSNDEKFADTIKLFESAGQSSKFFDNSYGYAVFPTVGKGGIGIGAAHGKGRVYVQGHFVGTTTLNQLSLGLQLGGQAYSQIIFFQDRRSFDEFTSGNFEFGAQVSAVAITAGVSAKASTSGAAAGASGGKKDATTAGSYYKGVAVFTIAKGGLMYEVAVEGQKFSYTALPDQHLPAEQATPTVQNVPSEESVPAEQSAPAESYELSEW